MREALDIEVHGIVQGVGFRPFVYKAARRHLIDGWVLNATAGVFIHAEGESKGIDDFVMEISDNAPAAARVDEILMKEVPLADFDGFTIRYSDEAAATATTLVSPDLATCPECAAELFDPANRRFHYPFINCTNCGPRFTIIDKLPYDRKHTSMARFPMCEQCADEYGDPEDRRFHAQPDACFECGPHLAWRTADRALSAEDDLARHRCAEEAGETHDVAGTPRVGRDAEASDAIIDAAVELLRRGGIVAVKGLGGFHLACDARNADALAALRARKRRPTKPFAVMYPTLEALREECLAGEAEERLLAGMQRPIVLLKKKPGARIAAGLADGLSELGAMLPYTPLQHLLLAAFGGPLVMTSGNLHNEPIQTDDDEAFVALHGVADAFVGNDHHIRCRFDDSVVRVVRAGSAGEAVQTVRRARGFAPMPVAVNIDGETTLADGSARVVLAAGSEQKNTFCLLRGTDAFVSQHIGDMENAATYDAWLEAIGRFEALFEAKPAAVACDMHPEYLASKWAAEQASAGLPLHKVQHHHAHIAAVMGENALDEAVIGVAFDGTGYGVDGAIWGGEVMLCNRTDFERFANFSYVPMPGGAAAIKHPLRMAYGVLWQYDLLEHPAAAAALSALGEEAQTCDRMIERGLNCPMTSSAGRLLDAASALLGICTEPSYEGEAAVLLEAACDGVGCDESYEIALVKNTALETSTAHDTSVVLLDAEPLFQALLDDMATGVETGVMAAKVHNAFVGAIAQTCLVANAAYGIATVALGGGVFMNRRIVEGAAAALESAGFTVALSKELPPNDGAVSYGQAVVAAARIAAEDARGDRR
ncbi:MAG: carbamoyltransferase HypF [Slackia piriformis]|uniref:Carbamoyltransferase n=1 Tax=Slackia piriformis TaxID=626934 RepID=A0A943UWL0_9ACTN|nr:carbamoyltransferase HypF [Slackia piriformis]